MRLFLLCTLLAASLVAQRGPGLESFDATTTGSGESCTTTTPGTLPANWSFDGTVSASWIVGTGSTSSSGTGPSADLSGSGNYLYYESSSPCANSADRAIVVSPIYDVSFFSGTSGQAWLTFHRHMWGADIGTLIVEESDFAGGWNELGRFSGDRGNEWVGENFLLSPVADQVQLRFIIEHSGTGFEGDIAIDEVDIRSLPTVQRWQNNLPTATLEIQGIESPTNPLRTFGIEDVRTIETCPGSPAVIDESGAFTVRSVLGRSSYEIGYTFAPQIALPRNGGIRTFDGDVVNLDILNVGLGYVFGTFTPTPQPFPGAFLPGSGSAEVTVPYRLTGPTLVSMQAIGVDPAAIFGLRLSQSAEVRTELTTATPALPAGPAGDDSAVTVDLVGGPTCFGGSLSLFGNALSELTISSNGRLGASGLSTSAFASVSSAASGEAFAGFWTDLNPASAGSIDLTEPSAGVLSVAWNAVPYFGETAAVSFSITLDGNADTIVLDGLSSIVLNPGSSVSGSDDIFLGLSAGNGATDPGATAFTVGGMGSQALATDMLYEFVGANAAGSTSLPASIAGGVNSLTFTWNGSSYDWAAN